MFRRNEPSSSEKGPTPERVTSVFGPGLSFQGTLRGSGGVRIEGTLDGDVQLQGTLIVAESGKVNCQTLVASSVVVAGLVHGDIRCERLEIRRTGKVWGTVTTSSFSTEEGSFLRGQVQMEEKVDIGSTEPVSGTEEIEAEGPATPEEQPPNPSDDTQPLEPLQ